MLFRSAVVSVKVVSTHKEARSTHVEILKMDVQDEGRKERTVPKPQSCHEVKACLCLLLQKRKHVPGFFRHSSSPLFESFSSLSFLGRLLSLVSGLDFLVCWFCMAPAQCQTRLLDCSIGGVYECPWEPQPPFLLVAVMADLVAQCQVSGNPKMVRNLHISFFLFLH